MGLLVVILVTLLLYLLLRYIADPCNRNGVYVALSCDDSDRLHVDDLYCEFFMDFGFNSLNNQFHMHYEDILNCVVDKDFDLSANYVVREPKNRIIVTNFSDCSDLPHAIIDGAVDCALICVDVDSPVTHIDCIDVIPPKSEFISDPMVLCEFVHCACDAETCLEELYGPIDNIVKHQCCLTYTGPISATRVRVDLENCRIFYEDFYIPGCSDISLI